MPAQVLWAVSGATDVDSVVEVIQGLIPLRLAAVEAALQEEVRRLAGERYQRAGRSPGPSAMGPPAGVGVPLGQKLPIAARRVRDRQRGAEIQLETYARLQGPRQDDTGLLRRILLGLSARRYEECAEAVPEAFGLSLSTVSRRFIRGQCPETPAAHRPAAGRLRRRRPLPRRQALRRGRAGHCPGDHASGREGRPGLRPDRDGERGGLYGLPPAVRVRGLRWESGLLCMIDGANGRQAALRRVFGAAAVVQRCHWHKRETVLRYLPPSQQAFWRRKLQATYEQPTYAEAKTVLDAPAAARAGLSLPAAASLRPQRASAEPQGAEGRVSPMRMPFSISTKNGIDSRRTLDEACRKGS